MLGTTVYFRDNGKGWCVGKISRMVEGGEEVVCREDGGCEVRVRMEDVAIARPEGLGEVPNELSRLSALHPATFVMAIRKRYESGVMSTLVGPNVMLYLTPTPHGAMESIVASDSKKSDFYNPPTLYPPNYSEPDAQPLSDSVNRGLFEPLGYWTHAKSVYKTAMLTGRGTLVCLGETETESWLHRLAAIKQLRSDHASAVAAIRLGSTTASLPPQEDEFHDDLMYTTEHAALQSASLRVELALGRMGNGRWVKRDQVPASREHLSLTTLLADSHCILDIFLGSGGGRHSDPELNTPTSTPPRATYCRHTKFSYTPDGYFNGFFLKVFWTNRTEGRAPLHSFRVLANSKSRSTYLGARDHPSWYSPIPLVASGDAFDELGKVFQRLSFKKADIDRLWGIVAAVMLLKLIKFEDVQGKAEMFTDCIQEVAKLIAVSPQVLQYTLCPPTKLSRVAAEAKRDALCHALYEGAVQWLVANLNMRGNAQIVVDAPHVVSVINVPGVSKPPPGEHGCLGDLCHNICSDALWGLFDMSIFDTSIQTAETEKCPLDPLLDQLRGRPVLERLNPLLQTLSHLDINEPTAATETKECSHASGDTLQYNLVSIPAPPLAELYKNGVLGTTAGEFIKVLLRRCKGGSMAAEAISAMSELLASAKPATLARYWMLVINPAHPTPSATDDSRQLSFNGVMLENGLYACRVVETALLSKVGYPIQLPMTYFAAITKPIIYPSQIKQVGTIRAVKLVAETVFSSRGMAWERMVDLEPLPETPAPMHIGHTKVLLTPAAMERLDALRRFTMNKLAVLIQAFARATLPRQIWRRNYNAKVIQRFGRARISAGFRTELQGVASLKLIANEIVSCVGRRRTWRAVNGVATSPLSFRTLKKLLASQQRDRELFMETALNGHFEFGFNELEATALSIMQERAALLNQTYSAQRMAIESDEKTLRNFLSNAEAAAWSHLELVKQPLRMIEDEEAKRAEIVREEAVQRCEVLYTHYEYYRERIELSEHIEYICLLQDNNFMLQLTEEASNRLIITHSESRCRDLLMKDFTLRALKLDGIDDPSYGSDWKVELEGLRREVILSSEQSERGGLYRWFLVQSESIYRGIFTSQCDRWYGAVFGPGNPLVVQFKQDVERVKITRAEEAARKELQMMRVRALEKQNRRRILKTCERVYTLIRDTHQVVCEECLERSQVLRQYEAWVRKVAAGKPDVAVNPLEARERHDIATAEMFCRYHIKDRLVQEYGEMEGRARIIGYFRSGMQMMRKLHDDYAMLHAERRVVRETMAKRKPIVLKAFDPQKLVIKKSPVPPPVATPTPTPAPPPVSVPEPVPAPRYQDLYERTDRIQVVKSEEKCKHCEEGRGGGGELEGFRSVSPPRSISKQTALEEAQALLQSMLQHAESSRKVISPKPPSPQYDYSKIPDPFSFSPPPPHYTSPQYPPRGGPSGGSLPPSPSLTNAANTLSASLVHLQKLTGRVAEPPPAQRLSPHTRPPVPRRPSPANPQQPVATFSFADIYKS